MIYGTALAVIDCIICGTALAVIDCINYMICGTALAVHVPRMISPGAEVFSVGCVAIVYAVRYTYSD